MPKRCRDQLEGEDDESIPLAVQTFLWRQTSPFIRPRLNKQQDPQISVEQREACKSYEKVLVQNICFNLQTDLTNAIKKISRWKLIQSALPHVIHCSSTLLYRKNQFQDKLNASDTKLLYTLHWIILDASEECIDAELEQNIIKPPEHYLLPVTTIEVFIFQFAPLVTYLKNSDFLTNFRLENGTKLWYPIFNHEFPNIPSFTTQVKPKRSIFTSKRCEKSNAAKKFDDIFIGEEKPSDENTLSNDQIKNDDQVDNKITTRAITTSTTVISTTTTTTTINKTVPITKMTKEEEAKANLEKNKEYSKGYKLSDPSMATYLDIAVLRCLFASQWLEEGILWSLIFLRKRLQSIKEDMKVKSTRPRSSSLPYQKLTSMIYSVADNIQQRKAARTVKNDPQENDDNKNQSDSTQQRQTDTLISTAQQTGNTLNANLIDASLRRNSYTPSNVSGAEFPEVKSTKFKKQRTEEQLLESSCIKCPTTNSGTTINKDQEQRVSSSSNQSSFLANLRSDIQKFGQKRKPKSKDALSAVKKEHQKNRPTRCSSCDILDANNPKLSKQSSIQSNASSNSAQQTSSVITTSASISATCSNQISNGSVTSQTRSSPIKKLSSPVTSNKPSQSQKNNELQLQPSQLLKLKYETTSNILRGASLPTLNQQIITTTTTVTQSITESIVTQSIEHQPAEKRDSNNSTSSSTDTTVGSNTIGSNTYSISTTTATISGGSLGKNLLVPFQTDTASTSNQIDENQEDAINPIITITEHSPISSSTNQFFIGNTSKQQNESHVQTFTSNCTSQTTSTSSTFQPTVQSLITTTHQQSFNQQSFEQPLTSEKSFDLPIKRNLTDSKICYFRPSETEALGTLNYITKSGQICLLVILKAVHNISVRENVCTPRVCQGIMDILNELVSLGLLDHIKQFEIDNKENGKSFKFRLNDEFTVLEQFLDTSMNIFKQIGCEHGCNKQVKPVDVIKTRQDLHALLIKLNDASQTQFYNYFKELVYLKQLNELVDIYHAYLGFCTERTSSTNASRESSRKPAKLTSTISQSPSKQTENNNLLSTQSASNPISSTSVSSNITITTTVANENLVNNSTLNKNQTAESNSKTDKLMPTSPKPNSNKNIKKDNEQLLIKQKNFKMEELIIKCTFLPLIERLTKISKSLNYNENLSTYCDIRQMLIFIKTYHSTTFRKATLSSLVESAEQLKRRQQIEKALQQQKQMKDEEQSESGGVSFYINDENPQQQFTAASKANNLEKQNRKSFFKRRNLKTSSSQSMTGEESGTEIIASAVSESELIGDRDQIKEKSLKSNDPSSASFTAGDLSKNLTKLKLDSVVQQKTKYQKQNTYISDMLRTKGEEKFQKKDFVFQSPEISNQPSTSFLDQSLSSNNIKSSAKMNWFKGDRPAFVKSDQNNNQEKQINSDGVFVFSAGQNKEESQQTKIFTVGGVSAAANLYSGNTLAVAPIAEIRRSSFQSRTYLGKHLGFANDFNGKSIHKAARKAVEDQFLKIHLMSKRPGGPKLANGGGLDENQANAGQNAHTELSRKNSLSYLDTQNVERSSSYHPTDKQFAHKELDIISLKEGKILQLTVLKNGILKFSFLLESCPPGSLPEAPLIAAVLSLKSPVIARAAFFLELANFVHNCNFGKWPQWMKQNFPILRNSGPSLKPFCRPNPRSLGQNSNLQRYAGRMFYFWGEAISSYLEELIIKERLEEEKQDQHETNLSQNQHTAINDQDNSNLDTDADQSLNASQTIKTSNKRSKHDDEEEDFLDDQTVNPNGDDCPYALKFAAITCLTEITTYLRETHQTLKPEKIEKPAKKNLLGVNTTSQQSTGTGTKGFASLAKQVLAKDHSTDQDDHKPSAPPLQEKPEKKIVMTASRRWSMALSNLGLSNVARARAAAAASSDTHSVGHSLKESKDHSKEHLKETSSSGTHSSSGVIQSTPSSHGERRISFVIHEANEGENNSEHSSNTTLTHDENTNQQHHQAPIKRLSQSSALTGSSRPNLLNRRGTGTPSISGSSGQPVQSNQQSGQNQPTINLSNGSTSGSFKRRSIRLKKDRGSKRSSTLAEDQEDSGDYGNGIKRTDSLRSRRKVSGVSERSDTSDRAGDLSGDESGGVLSDEGQQSQESGYLMTYGKYSHFNVLEQDDQRLCSNMPWFKVINQFLLTLDYSCKHTNGCSKHCYRRQMRSCSKLIKTISKMYKFETRSKDSYYGIYKNYDDKENVKQLLTPNNLMSYQSGSGAFLPTGNAASTQHCSGEKKMDKKTIKSIYGSGSPIRRKVSMSQHHDRMIDRDSGHLSLSVHGSSSFLPHLEIDAGSTNTTVYGYSSSAIQPSNFNQLSSQQQSDPQKSFLEANRQRLFQKHCVKSRQLHRQTNDQTSGEDEFIENMSKFVENCIRNLFHSPISLLLKGFLVLPDSIYPKLLHTSWHLILESDQHLSCTAAVAFILCSFKCNEQATELLNSSLNSNKASEQIDAMRRFQIIWKFRYQCWPRMEENAQNRLKLPPPTIEFTLPSPKIALNSMPVANPPYFPQSKYKVEEVTINQEQTLQKSFVTATKTRRKQQIEMIHKALADQQEKMREERESYVISAVAIANEASYEPALHKADEHEEDPEDIGLNDHLPSHHLQVAQPIFTSAMCSASLTIINLLNNSQVNENGNAVYEIAYKIIWFCLVEDTSLFLRNLFERLTKENGKYILQILRRIIRFMPRLPAQAAFSLYNYLIGFIMYHVRTPAEGSQELIGTTLSVLWLVVPSVHGLFLKGLKQVLRKEQCDAHVLITANVPSTKRIIVHGPESVGIPSQFNVQEDTQFAQILSESLEYFSIDEKQVNEYYLLDSKSNQIHNLGAFVRDFYFFKRSQYPQLTLTHMNPEKAAELLQKQALTLQFTELGKVLMSLSIVNSPNLAIQRVLFLHEELMKLPSFPRKALESNFQLHHYHGSLYGRELTGMDTLHKLVWVKLVARMLEVTSGFFAQSNDIHLFLNVVNGALILHAEDSSVLRLCMATYLNAAHQFKNIFNINGYLLIMPTILRIYSNHQTNALLCKTVEFVCKQFYIIHRKPFLLQMFGSASTILDTDSHSLGDATKVQPKAFFQLLQSMSSYSNEPMQILDLVQAEKPLRALDFCYQMDTEHISILDTISICVTVIGYAADSQRAFQMLTILEAILPLFMKHNQTLTQKKEAPGGPRDELTSIHNISVCIKTLINNCEALTRNFTGPQRAIDLRSSSIKNASKGAYSPMEVDEDSHSNPTNGQSAPPNLGAKTGYPQYNLGNSSEDNETLRAQFRQPRDVLLNVVCEYLTRSTARLAELSKKIPDLHPSKNSSHELLDVKCHLRLAEIAHSLLKVAPYDPETMHSRGLIRYMNEILPTSDWRQESMRPALIIILRRLDKMFNKIAKKGQLRRWVEWEAAKKLLKGIYSTFLKHPYIVHLPHLKSLISVCQYIVLGDNVSSSNMLSSGNTNVLSGVGLSNNGLGLNAGTNAGVIGGIGNLAQASSNTAGLSSLLTPDISNQLTNFNSWTTALQQSPPAGFCSVVVRLIASQLLQLNENQTLETICSGIFSNNTEKTEIYLMNMIYPMCIRISGSIREVPKLRTCDITLILSAILNTLNSNTTKSGNWQTGINKTISVNTLHQIGFLGLKIMIACFERQLSNDWPRISRCIIDLTNKHNCSGVTIWKFFDFIVTYRCPLFILLLPLIKYRLLTRYCDNDEEYYYQQQISEKLQGRNFYHRNLSKGNLFKSLFNELNNLKNNLVTKRIDDNRTKPNVTNTNANLTAGFGQTSTGHRLSFAIIPPRSAASNIIPSAPNLPQSPIDEQKNILMNMNASTNSSINIASTTSTPNRMKSLLNRGFSIRSSISSQSSAGADSRSARKSLAEKARGLSVRLPSTSRGGSASSNLVDKFLRRTSYPYNNEDLQVTSSSPPGKDSSLENSATEGGASVPSTGNDVTMLKEGDKIFTFEENAIQEQQRIDDSQIIKDDSPKTIQEQGSFDESVSSESKLHRQKAQSKKMFRNRKSKKKTNTSEAKLVTADDTADKPVDEKIADKIE